MTPLYKRLKSKGTTTYCFPSAAQHTSAAYQNPNFIMYFSNFALLNLPKQNTTTTSNAPIQWDFENSFDSSPGSIALNATTYSEQIVESLRNYVANQESTIKSSKLDNTQYYYNNNVLSTPTEKIFYKWLKKLNIIDFEKAAEGDDFVSTLTEFNSNSKTDDSYFPEVLWKERTVIAWEVPDNTEAKLYIYETASGLNLNKTEVEFLGDTNIKVGDKVILTFDNTSQVRTTYSKLVNVLESFPSTNTEGQRIVLSIIYGDSELVGASNISIKVAYNQVVNYVGEVNGVNNVQNNDRSYTEVYANIPDHVGRTPDILFRTSYDDNYKPNLTYPILPSQYQAEIVGAENFNSPIIANPQNYPGGYYGQFDTPDYVYQTSSGDVLRRSGDYYGVGGDVNTPVYDSTNIDGLGIDFEPSHYVKMNLRNEQLTSFEKFSALAINGLPPVDFSFNAILWYYTVETSKGEKATNLYAVSFLDNPENNKVESEAGVRFPTFDKLVSTDSQDGTSYTFAINLDFKLETESPQQLYNPDAINSLFSMDLYNDAMQKLTLANERFLTSIQGFSQVNSQLNALKQLLYTQPKISDLQANQKFLESLLRKYQTLQLIDSSTITTEQVETTGGTFIRLNNIDSSYGTLVKINSTSLYNTTGVVPYNLTLDNSKNALVNFINDDTSDITLLGNLQFVLSTELAYKQEITIDVNADAFSTKNKKFDLYLNSTLSDGTNKLVKLLSDLDLPIGYNAEAKTPQLSLRANGVPLLIDTTKNVIVEDGYTLRVPLIGNSNIISKQIKAGDIVSISNFTLEHPDGIFVIDGQYPIVEVDTLGNIVLLMSSSKVMESFVSKITIPTTINNYPTTGYLSAIPVLKAISRYQIKIVRTVSGETLDAEKRYSVSLIS
jgi:hypothetical protein